MRGVPGGAGMRENSAAREVRGVCVGESARMRLVFLERSEMSDWGVMSSAYSGLGGIRSCVEEQHKSEQQSK